MASAATLAPPFAGPAGCGWVDLATIARQLAIITQCELEMIWQQLKGHFAEKTSRSQSKRFAPGIFTAFRLKRTGLHLLRPLVLQLGMSGD